MERKANFKKLIPGKFVKLTLNICLITSLFYIFNFIFKFIKFILIFKELNYLWVLYSNYYFLITIFFTISWLATSYLFTSFFFNNKNSFKVF